MDEVNSKQYPIYMPRENNSPIKPLGAKIKDCLASTLNVNLFVYGLFLCLMVCIGAITNNQYSITNIKEAKAEGIAQTVNYQARLMNSSGINVGDGTYSMKISIYSQASGGSHLWSASTTEQTPTGTVQPIEVEVKNGLFSILLGDISDDQVAFPEGLFNNESLYLGITIGADSEMTPRKRLSAVPYAYNSQTLQGQYASNTVASTGGDLFALHQSSNDSASAERTALAIYTSGTNNLYDLLIKANSGSDVFSVSRQGSVTTTGNLQVAGVTQLGSTLSVAATSSLADLSLTGRVNSNLLPYITDTYSLGNSTYRWLGLYAQNVTTTNLAADYVTTTELWVDGVQVTGGIPNLDQVTDEGNITTNAIGVGGVSSTGNILPTQTARRWKDIWVSSTYIGDNTWNLKQDANNYFTIADVGGSRRLTIDTSGNVGIGITDPTRKLHLSNTTAVTDSVGSPFLLNSRSTGDMVDGFGGGMLFGINDNTLTTENIIATIYGIRDGADNSGALTFNTYLTGTRNERLRISPNGNVGIGDTSPYALFTVGDGDLFQVSSTGNLAKIRNVGYEWPTAQGVANTFLKNDGSGTLTWATVAGASTPSWAQVTLVGATSSEYISFYGASSTGHITPGINDAFDLGSASTSWRNLYVSSTGYLSKLSLEAPAKSDWVTTTVLTMAGRDLDAVGDH